MCYNIITGNTQGSINLWTSLSCRRRT